MHIDDELIMNERENEMMMKNEESMLAHQLFTNLSLNGIPEESSKLEETMMERLKQENRRIQKSHEELIEMVHDLTIKCEKQARKIEKLEVIKKRFIHLAEEGIHVYKL